MRRERLTLHRRARRVEGTCATSEQRARSALSVHRWRPDDTGKEACTQDANKAASGQTLRLVWPSNAHGYAGSRLTCSPGPRRKSV